MHYIMLPKSINSLRTIVFGRFRWVSPFWAEVKFGCYKVLSHPFIYAAFRLNSVVQLKCRSSPYWGCFWLGISSHDSLDIQSVTARRECLGPLTKSQVSAYLNQVWANKKTNPNFLSILPSKVLCIAWSKDRAPIHSQSKLTLFTQTF